MNIEAAVEVSTGAVLDAAMLCLPSLLGCAEHNCCPLALSLQA